MHGKAYAKTHINQTNGDRSLRNQQDGQTVGIPIGPDASLIIAELVLAAVDAALAPRRPNGLRYVDDYELGFRSLGEAEASLTELQGLLSEFELSLNPRKTTIVEGPIAIEEAWAVELGRFVFRDSTATRQLNDAVAFFSRAFELAVEHKHHSVLRYAVVTAQRWRFTDDGWRTFQGLLFRAASADPGTLPVTIVLLANHLAIGRQLNRTAAREVIEAMVARHAPLGHGSEVAWALWTAIQFDVELSAQTAESISAMSDDVVALLAMHADTRGIFPRNALSRAAWQQILNTPGVLHDEHWLLAYEANRKGWLQCAAVAQHPFFSVLEANAITFYDVTRHLTAFVGAAAAVPGGALGRGYG